MENNLQQELVKLLRIQFETLETEVFLGLTEEQQREYDLRAERIERVSKKLHNRQNRNSSAFRTIH